MLDHDLVAQCWLCSWPFREGRTTSTEIRTRRALTSLLGGGYSGLITEVGHEEAARVINRAAFQDPPLAPKTALVRPLRIEEQNEWVAMRNNVLDLRDYYSDAETEKAFWHLRVVNP